MKFSTRTRYGLRLLSYLANTDANRYVQLGEISEAEGISQKYLEQIVRLLKPSGFIKSTRGVSGGYQLAESPDKIKLQELFEHLEGDLAPISCLKDNNCSRQDDCPTLPMWKELEALIRSYLSERSLSDMMMMKE